MTAAGNQSPGVKQLDWQIDISYGEETRYAETILGRYVAWEDRGIAYVLVPDALRKELVNRQPVGTWIDDALAFCQSDFEQKIRSVLA